MFSRISATTGHMHVGPATTGHMHVGPATPGHMHVGPYQSAVIRQQCLTAVLAMNRGQCTHCKLTQNATYTSRVGRKAVLFSR